MSVPRILFTVQNNSYEDFIEYQITWILYVALPCGGHMDIQQFLIVQMQTKCWILLSCFLTIAAETTRIWRGFILTILIYIK